jgi:Flagellar-associated PapD-like
MTGHSKIHHCSVLLLSCRVGNGPQPACELLTATYTMQDEPASELQRSLVLRLQELELEAAQRAHKVALERQRSERVAAGSNYMEEFEALLQKAGASAAECKVYRAWQRTPGEFEALPQAPHRAEILKYFSSEEGVKAMRAEALSNQAGAEEYHRLQQRLQDAQASQQFADRDIYGVVEERETYNGPGDESHGLNTTGTVSFEEPSDPPQSAVGVCNTSATGNGSPARGNPERCSPVHGSNFRLPKIYRQPKAATALNDEYLKREYLTKSMVKTASAELIRARGRDDVEFELGCVALDFGDVPLGTSVARKVPLRNVSLERARFSVDQVVPPLKVTCPPGPVPAGLRTQILVEFHAHQPGHFVGQLVVRSAVNVLHCQVCANVTEKQGWRAARADLDTA